MKGIIILNYLANDLLNQIDKVASTSNGNLFLLNADGYWIYDSKNSENDWSFMYEDKTDISFKNKFKDEWNYIQSKDSGYLINKKGVFIFSKVNLSENWVRYIIARFPDAKTITSEFSGFLASVL